MTDLKNGIEQAVKYWDKKSDDSSSNLESVEQNGRPQRMRYESFILANDLTNTSILDVGCGAGDFLYHLNKKDIPIDYFGTDISQNMVERCSARFPQEKFSTIDIRNLSPEKSFDYVVSFGIHNIKVESAWDILKEYTQKQFDLCSTAAHMSILTDRYTGRFDEHIQAWTAEEVFKMALDITPYVSLQHNYLPNDFSITLYREPIIDTKPGLMLDYE